MHQDAYSPPAKPRLPPELVDTILDFLHDDWSALTTCSLVSREWVATCRFHLFNDFVVPLGDAEDRIVGLVHILDTSPTIRGTVHTLLIKEQTNPRRFTRVVRRRYDPVLIDTTELGVVLGKLPNLTSLTLQGVFWKVSPAFNPLHHSISHSVTALSIRTPRYFDCEVFANGLFLFAGLKELHIGGATWNNIVAHNCVEGITNIPPLHLETLRIETVTFHKPILGIVRRTPSIHTLTSISLPNLGPDDLRSVGDLFQDLGRTRSLRHLIIGMTQFKPKPSRSIDFDAEWSSIQLTSLSELQTLSVEIPTRFTCVSSRGDLVLPVWRYAANILSQAPPSLKQVILVGKIAGPTSALDIFHNELRMVPWDPLIQSLNKSIARGLKSVIFLQHHEIPFLEPVREGLREPMRSLVRDHLLLSQSDILRFE